MTELIKNILKEYDEIDKMSQSLSSTLKIAEETAKRSDRLKRGFEVSKLASQQQKEVAMTPIMKNILEKFDPTIDRLMVDHPMTKAEAFIQAEAKSLLDKYYNTEFKEEYDKDKTISDPAHYRTDC